MRVGRKVFLTVGAAASLLVAAECRAVEVLGGCQQPAGEGTTVLLDLVCTSSADCWPDPDDVDLQYADGKIPDWGFNNLVWIGPDGKVLKAPPETFPQRAVWDLSNWEKKLGPDKVRLSYDGEPLTRFFVLKHDCKDIPAEAVKAFRFPAGAHPD